MAKKIQARTLETRAKLLQAARAAVRDSGYAASRVEDIVARAGVAKGTFFAHFKDKDALMDQLIGAEMHALLADAGVQKAPQDAPELVARLQPLHDFMTHERYVFDIALRYSGAADVDDIGPIAMAFGRYIDLAEEWMQAGTYRSDLDLALLAEGIQAFAVQAMALEFCSLHKTEARDVRLQRYLEAWLKK